MMSPLLLTALLIQASTADQQPATAAPAIPTTSVQAKLGFEYDDYAEGLSAANGAYAVLDLIGTANRWTLTFENWRKFGEVANRGGVGFTRKLEGGRWLRLVASFAPDASVIPEQDYTIGGSQVLPRGWALSGDYRHVRFDIATVHLISSMVEYYLKRPIWLSATLGKTFTEFLNTGQDADNQFVILRYNHQIRPPVTLHLGAATGSEPVSTLSVDRIGEFEADTIFAGVDYDFSPAFGITFYASDQRSDDGPDLQTLNIALTVRH